MFKNKEVKKYTIIYVAAFICIGIAMFFVLKNVLNGIESSYYQELLQNTGNTNSLAETGKTHYLPSEYNDIIKKDITMFYVASYAFLTVLGVVGYILGLILYKFPMKAIERVTDNSRAVLEGDYDNINISEIDEGDISEFYSIYTKMVTAIKQGRDKEKAERVFLQDLIADISHQLKTPLATLTIYQELLCNPKVSDDKKQETLELMGKQLSRMEWLILSLLKLARLESGAIVFAPSVQPLYLTIQMAYQNVSMLVKERNQTVTISCDKKIRINHDVDWLAEALTNILKNATEYSPVGGTIEINAEHSQIMTMIHIKDYGKGIAKEDIPKIFKRFYRAKSDVNENSIGIGLSLSKVIVEGQGGDITVKSEAGKYTCFTISFYHA